MKKINQILKHMLDLRILLFTLLLSTVSFSDEPINSKNRKFILLGDTQHIGFWESLYWDYWNEHNEKKTKSLIKEMSNHNPDFIIHLGDLTRDGSNERAWHEFDLDNKPICEKNIPYYPIFGNHEYFYSSGSMYNSFFKRFPHINWQKWYSFVYDQIGFIMLNSNFDDLSAKDTSAQKQWYLKLLSEMEIDSSIKRIIVTSHHPPFTNSKMVGTNKVVQHDYAEPFTKTKKGILFFSGHCHSYERFLINGKMFIVSGGGGGPRQKLNIDKNKRAYNDLFNGPSVRFLHFCEIESSKDSLHLKVIRLNGNNSFSVAEKLDLPK